jgi:glycosyltransferase involved in cell wall biosynthesis
MPFFSVIIPTYNRAAMLAATLQTVLVQDFTDFEILVIDDGSTDDTPQMMAQNFANYKQIKYLRKKNEERSVARNFGMKQAKGEFAVFFDSDDFMHIDYLSTLYAAILQYPACNFFACHRQFAYEGKTTFNETANLKAGFYDYRLLLKGSIFGTVVCARLNNPNLALFPPEFNILEDWVFNLLNLRNDKLYFIDKITLTVNDHPNRSMQDNQKAISSRRKVTEFLLPKLNLSPDEIKIFRGYGHWFCAIHSYIDGNRLEALHDWKKTMGYLGISPKLLVFLAKILVGKKVINWLK